MCVAQDLLNNLSVCDEAFQSCTLSLGMVYLEFHNVGALGGSWGWSEFVKVQPSMGDPIITDDF